MSIEMIYFIPSKYFPNFPRKVFKRRKKVLQNAKTCGIIILKKYVRRGENDVILYFKQSSLKPIQKIKTDKFWRITT